MIRFGLSALAVLAVAACTPAMPDSGVGFGGNTTLDPVRAEPLAPVAATPATTAQAGSAAISDEQDFNAVASRETIESDRERLEQNRAQYTVIAPTALPSRNGNEPNIVAYALSTTNQVGQPVYKRFSLSGAAGAERNCAKYAAHDLAQIAFLEAGGPQRDRLGLDPDGDGFACGWNPAPFRLAAKS